MSDTLYESYDDVQGVLDYRTTHWGAQTFTPQITHNITSIKLYLKQTDATSLGDVTFSIKAVDGEGKPTGADLASWTGTNDWGNVSATLQEIVFDTFAAGGKATLQAGTQYAIVERAPNAPSNKYLGIGRRFTSPAYAGGKMIDSVNGGSSWTILEQDQSFYEYGLIPTPAGGIGGPASLLIAHGQI